ncbi:MAG TPA: helix-turn-helix transcriptional regulator [Zoogloea sp.]|jgi:DNA-binding Xre family transcriptional regulator|nr:helix-turn-helix transcriptional regulator [Zoogloea sp.]
MSLNYPVTWRLRECMQKAKIDSALELHRRMKLVDPKVINYAQLARMIDTPPARLNLQTLTVLTVVLSCKVSDIMDVPPAKDMLETKRK